MKNSVVVVPSLTLVTWFDEAVLSPYPNIPVLIALHGDDEAYGRVFQIEIESNDEYLWPFVRPANNLAEPTPNM